MLQKEVNGVRHSDTYVHRLTSDWGPDAVAFFAAALQYEPAARPTAAQLLQMPFLAQ